MEKSDSNTQQAVMAFLLLLNVLSLLVYSIEWIRTGSVITTSGMKVQGYHEAPALVALAAYVHQVSYNPRKGWHRNVGKVAIISTVVCLATATQNLKPGIVKQFHWTTEEILPVEDRSLRLLILILNETVNVHQFIMYGPLLINQLWMGYQSAKQKRIQKHENHIRSSMMFLLGPLAQRFLFNHVYGKRDDVAVFCQFGTYSILMALLYSAPVARKNLQLTLAGAMLLAIAMVQNNTSALRYLLLAAEGEDYTGAINVI